MRTIDRRNGRLILAGVLAIFLVACGGAGETTSAPDPAPAAEPTAPPAPPPTDDLDLEPGVLSLGGNALTGSITTNNLLPPNAFGTVTVVDVVVNGAEIPSGSITIRQAADNTKWLTIARDATDGTLSWSNDLGEITAYALTPGQACSTMSANLVAYFASGNSISYSTGGPNPVVTRFTGNMKIRAAITSNSACP